MDNPAPPIPEVAPPSPYEGLPMMEQPPGPPMSELARKARLKGVEAEETGRGAELAEEKKANRFASVKQRAAKATGRNRIGRGEPFINPKSLAETGEVGYEYVKASIRYLLQKMQERLSYGKFQPVGA